MKKYLLLLALLFATPALAQTSGEVANHAVPIGKGPGVQGFGAASPGAAGGLLTSGGPTVDPTFQLLATIAQYYAGTSTAPIPPSIIYQPEVGVGYGTTVTLDLSTFINAYIVLTGNITTLNAVNTIAGKSGVIRLQQDGAGNHTITSWPSAFVFAGGTKPTLSTSANINDILSYSCLEAGFCVCSFLKGVQ